MSSTCNIKEDEKILNKPDKILLMGNPNVGKSVFFSELTGISAVSSNYTGSTVSFLEGKLIINEKKYTLIDVPGTYSLDPNSEAETVAARFIQSGAKAVICVLDATNLERNLRLALEIAKFKIPTIYALNLLDVAKRTGIKINEKWLSKELNAPVVPTVAVKVKGFDELKTQLAELLRVSEDKKESSDESCVKCDTCPSNKACNIKELNDDMWAAAKQIAKRVVTKENDTEAKRLEKLSEAMMKPKTGIPIAILVIGLLIGFVAGASYVLRNLILLPIIDGSILGTDFGVGIVPFFRWIFSFIPSGREYIVGCPEGTYEITHQAFYVLTNILVGDFGIFVISFQWIFGLILPYVFLFYVAFSILEDTGYMPRFAVLCDNVMRKLGVQGGSLIQIMLGFGCAVPAIIGTRTATTKRERLIVSAAICVAIPCISQIAAIFTLLTTNQGLHALYLLPLMFIFMLVMFCITMLVLSKLIKGKSEPLLIEVPNLLIPSKKTYFRKLRIRMKHFMKDAELPMIIAIVIVALVMGFNFLNSIASVADPFTNFWLGLPGGQTTVALITGIIRREMSTIAFVDAGLNPLQAFVAGTVSLLYLPCISVVGILFKELKVKASLLIIVSTIGLAFLFGGAINWLGQLFIFNGWIGAAVLIGVIAIAVGLVFVLNRVLKKKNYSKIAD